jgi:hypothetical protein
MITIMSMTYQIWLENSCNEGFLQKYLDSLNQVELGIFAYANLEAQKLCLVRPTK